jgi:hypothetical protein
MADGTGMLAQQARNLSGLVLKQQNKPDEPRRDGCPLATAGTAITVGINTKTTGYLRRSALRARRVGQPHANAPANSMM